MNQLEAHPLPWCRLIRGVAISLSFIVFSQWLAASEPAPSLTLRAPMRDGVKLATDIYLPDQTGGPWPCVLIRTPYDRTRYNQEYGAWARLGYGIAIQDTRGRFASEGKAMAFQSDAWGLQQDGYDTVEWLAKQSFCNGKVGTVGASAMGIAQVLMAPAAPPSLVCQYIQVAPSSLYHEANYQGDVFRKNQVENWMKGNAHPDAGKMVLAHPDYDDFWHDFDIRSRPEKIMAPAIHYGGWFDTFCEGTINNFVIRQEKGGPGAKGTQKLVMGPWTHGGGGAKSIGEFPMPAAGRRPPYDIGARRWFEHYLKGVDNGIERVPAVQYYVMGPFDGSPSKGNRWKSAEQWPVPTTTIAYSLTADHTLTQAGPAKTGRLSFMHNPTNPVPTVGGRNLSLPAGPLDQRKLEKRPDVLVFSTEALADDVEITGKVMAHIWLSAEAPETHLAARLCDVYPDGRSILICEGIQRVKLPTPAQSRPDDARLKPVKVAVDLWSTSMVFAKGHQVRLSLCGSNYPRWEVGKSAPGNPLAPVVNTIHLGVESDSQLLLPVIK